MDRADKQRIPVAVNETTATFYRALDLPGRNTVWRFAKQVKLTARAGYSTGGTHQSVALWLQGNCVSIATVAFATASKGWGIRRFT